MTSPFASASLFPVDLDVAASKFGLLELDASVLEDAVFLDNRIGVALDRAQWVPAATLAIAAPPAADPPALLFHTSFCCSTLLARALHVPPHAVALKEPLVLRRLGDARRAGRRIDGLPAVAMRMLARPWSPGGRVVIKPTHAALNVARELLDAAPAARGVVLYGSLEDFLVSNLKKPADTQAKVPELAERALAASDLPARLPRDALAPPDFLCAVALQWCAQLEVAADLVDGSGGRVRALTEHALLADVPGTVADVAAWTGLGIPDAALAARVAAVSGRHAKAPGVAYDATARAADAATVRAHVGPQIADALRWAERVVFPALRRTIL